VTPLHDETCFHDLWFKTRSDQKTWCAVPASAVVDGRGRHGRAAVWSRTGFRGRHMDWVAIAPEEQRMRLALALARAATHKLRSRSPRSAPRSPRSAPSLPSSPKARLGLSPRERATLHAFAPMSPRIKGCPAEEVCAHAYEPSGPSSALSHSSSLTATDASLCFSMLPRRSASKTACST
jgi:hypothetical protein